MNSFIRTIIDIGIRRDGNFGWWFNDSWVWFIRRYGSGVYVVGIDRFDVNFWLDVCGEILFGLNYFVFIFI